MLMLVIKERSQLPIEEVVVLGVGNHPQSAEQASAMKKHNQRQNETSCSINVKKNSITTNHKLKLQVNQKNGILSMK